MQIIISVLECLVKRLFKALIAKPVRSAAPASANCSAGSGFAAFSSRLLGLGAASRSVCIRCSLHQSSLSGSWVFISRVPSRGRPRDCHSLSGGIQYCHPMPVLILGFFGFCLHFSLSAFFSSKQPTNASTLHPPSLPPLSSPFPASIFVVYITYYLLSLVSSLQSAGPAAFSLWPAPASQFRHNTLSTAVFVRLLCRYSRIHFHSAGGQPHH